MQDSIASEKALVNKNRKNNNDEHSSTSPERYTIFHALLEAMKEKEKKYEKK